MNIKTFQSIDACATALADDLAEVLANVLEQRAGASLALSGGRSPQKVLPRLAAKPLRWSDVAVTLSDERCVPFTDKNSNAAMVRTNFLEQGAEQASFYPLWTEGLDLETGLKAAADELQNIVWPLDVIYLGMGDDGHFASLFPSDDMATFDADNSPVVAGHASSSPFQRISLSLSTILKARHLFLHVTGAAKCAVFENARTITPTPECPISLLVQNDEIDLHVYMADGN